MAMIFIVANGCGLGYTLKMVDLVKVCLHLYLRWSCIPCAVQRQDYLGHTPSTAGTFGKKFRKNSGKTPKTLSERFLEFPSRVQPGCPKPYNSRHLRLPEHLQNTARDASF